ncbi:hypothetical protein ACLOJK_040480 [Asimina triloba]
MSLTLRDNASFYAELYFPHRFARQFGFDQGMSAHLVTILHAACETEQEETLIRTRCLTTALVLGVLDRLLSLSGYITQATYCSKCEAGSKLPHSSKKGDDGPKKSCMHRSMKWTRDEGFYVEKRFSNGREFLEKTTGKGAFTILRECPCDEITMLGSKRMKYNEREKSGEWEREKKKSPAPMKGGPSYRLAS